MDPARFDALVRAASRSGSRRGLLGGLSALALPPLIVQAKPTPGGQSTCKGPGQVCRKRANCCATPCRKKRGKPTGRCKACAGDATYCGTVCCQPGEDCVGGACTCGGGICPNGCCANRTCVSPPTDAQCGTNGAACTVCVAPETCGGGNPGTPGVCGCTPDCAGKVCGDPDGCGGLCTGGCPNGQTCRHGGCFLPCGSDNTCTSCGGASCACGAAERLCQDTATGLGVCTSDADCPIGALCSAFRNGSGQQLCTQPCRGCTGA